MSTEVTGVFNSVQGVLASSRGVLASLPVGRIVYTIFCLAPIALSYYIVNRSKIENDQAPGSQWRKGKKRTWTENFLDHFSPVIDLCRELGFKRFAQPPLTPTDVTITEVKFETFTVSWSPNRASFFNRDSFHLNVKELDSERGWRELNTETRNSFPVTMLDAGTRYRVRVRAYNHLGESPWTEELIQITPQKRNKDFGGIGPGYTWTQNEETVHVQVPVPATTKRGDVSFAVKDKYLFVKVKTNGFELEGETCGHIDPDSSTWQLAEPRKFGCDTERRMLQLELEKAEHENPENSQDKMPKFMWSHIVKGQPKIEIKKYLGTKRQPPESFHSNEDMNRMLGRDPRVRDL